MPRYTKRQEKFKCKEIACGLIVRGDKWNAHCKSHHGYAMKQGREIKKETIAVKEGDGPWTVLTLQVVAAVAVFSHTHQENLIH